MPASPEHYLKQFADLSQSSQVLGDGIMGVQRPSYDQIRNNNNAMVGMLLELVISVNDGVTRDEEIIKRIEATAQSPWGYLRERSKEQNIKILNSLQESLSMAIDYIEREYGLKLDSQQ